MNAWQRFSLPQRKIPKNTMGKVLKEDVKKFFKNEN